jgi:hypothetical protein
MSRKTFDSTEYHRAKNNFDGFCLGCGKKIGFSKYLILTKKGDLRGEPMPNKLLVCNSACEELFLKRTLKNWHELRIKAFKRDNFVCQDCGRGPAWPFNWLSWKNPPELKWYYPLDANEHDIVLEAHHTKPISEGGPEFDLDNLVTLCFECHHLGRHGSKAPTPEEIAQERLQARRSQHICLDQFSEVS